MLIITSSVQYWACERVIHFFYTSNQLTSNLCPDLRKVKQHLRLGYLDLGNYPRAEYPGLGIFLFNLYFFGKNCDILSNYFEPFICKKFKQLLGLRPSSGCFYKKKSVYDVQSLMWLDMKVDHHTSCEKRTNSRLFLSPCVPFEKSFDFYLFTKVNIT